MSVSGGFCWQWPAAGARFVGCWRLVLAVIQFGAAADALRLARSYSIEAMKRLAALIRGKLKGPDGALVPGQDAAQMRLAMNSLLNRAGVVHEVNLADEDDGGVEVIGIKIVYPEGGSSGKNA